MEHQFNNSGELIHRWRIGSDVIRESYDEVGFYLGTCIISQCGKIRTWPAFVDEKSISEKKRVTALSSIED